MKTNLFFTLFIIFTCFTVYSQDTIVQTNGEKILCKVQREDSTKVFFTITKSNRVVSTYLNKSNITSVKYGTNQTGQSGQTDQQYIVSDNDKTSLGIGFGMDYGGIGGNLLVYPQNNIGLFAGVGYAFAGVGYNLGVKLRLITEKHTSGVSAYLVGMYGYNAAISVTNADQFNKLFYGPTFGFGLDYKSFPSKRSYWTFSLLVPIRGSEVDDYITDLKNNHGVVFKNDLLPIAFSIGYRFILN
jgi:hypothetical protein